MKGSNIKMKFTLRQHRKIQNITLNELAKRMNKSTTAILNWEGGKTDIKKKDWDLLLEILGISEEQIIFPIKNN